MSDLRKFMFANVYTNPKAKAEEQKAQDMLEHLFSFYKEHPEKMSEEYRSAQIGALQQVLFEESAGQYYVGHTPNYIKVYIPGQADLHNQIHPVRITRLYRDGVLGELIL